MRSCPEQGMRSPVAFGVLLVQVSCGELEGGADQED